MLPLVTIIIPTYGNNKIVFDAINSALSQTYANIECIVVNDYSEKNKIEFKLCQFCKKNNIKYIFNKTNLGYKKNFDFCWSLANGKYVMILHHDDIMYKNIIEEYIKILESNIEIGAISCKTMKNYNNKLFKQNSINKQNITHEIYDTNNFIDLYLTKGHPEIASLMIKTELVQKREPLKFYHENMQFYDDYCLWIDLSIKTKIAIVYNHLLIRRINENQSGAKVRKNGLQNKNDYFDLMLQYIEWINEKVKNKYVDKTKLNDWIKITLSLYYLSYPTKINKNKLFAMLKKLNIFTYYSFNIFKIFINICLNIPYPLDYYLFNFAKSIKKILCLNKIFYK